MLMCSSASTIAWLGMEGHKFDIIILLAGLGHIDCYVLFFELVLFKYALHNAFSNTFVLDFFKTFLTSGFSKLVCSFQDLQETRENISIIIHV